MIEDPVSVDQAIRVLNQATEDDRQAMAALVEDRIPCSRRLARHPSIQVGRAHGGHRVGMLGIINGLFGIDDRGYGPISAIYNEAKPPTLVGFERTRTPKGDG